jgi:hypothetical protein
MAASLFSCFRAASRIFRESRFQASAGLQKLFPAHEICMPPKGSFFSKNFIALVEYGG